MVGSAGNRVLSIALPYVDAWNTWYDNYGNTPEGFAALNAKVSDAAVQSGRRPEEISRSACVLVVLDRAAGDRLVEDGVTPLEGSPDRIGAGLRELAEAGADEAIVVASPITEGSIRALGDVVASLDS
jgi:alkanesulfonate monooxygenase SsuD/methylene tetrahydromethanopterin reductase-like flavin-dependent oxidoreductase (luciferase family)